MVRVERSPVSHVSLEGQSDRWERAVHRQVSGEAGLRGKIEADEAATGDAWYDEEEEAMLRPEERRAEGAVADEEEARTNANSSTAVPQPAPAPVPQLAPMPQVHICLACPCFCSSDEQVVGSQDCLWYCVSEGPRTNEQALGGGAIQAFLDTHPWYPAWISKKKNTQHRRTNQLMFYSI